MPDTHESLLREMAELFAEQPYHARGLRGPFDCVFCGGTTDDERCPKHESDCVWPRVLKLLGGMPLSGTEPLRKPPLSSYGKRIAVLIRTEERLAREKAKAAAKTRKAAKRPPLK